MSKRTRQNLNRLCPKTGDSPLHRALYDGKKRKAEFLLRIGADPNLTNTVGSKPLHIICNRAKLHEFASLFFEICDEKGQPLQVDARDKSGNTPLHLVLKKGHEELTESLLRRGASPNLPDVNGLTPLRIIYDHRNDEWVEKFFEICGEVKQTVQLDTLDNEGNAVLHLAINHKRKKIVELLLRYGANPNLVNAEGWTPLHFISEKNEHSYYDRRCYALGNDDNCLLKLFFKINDEQRQTLRINAQDHSGNTPLIVALSCRNDNVVDFLLARGADPKLANNDGSTPLHFISKRVNDSLRSTKFFEILDDIQKTVQVDIQDAFGRTPLQWAVASVLPNTVNVLLDRGADLSNFVFPTASYFGNEFTPEPNERAWTHLLRLASSVLAIVDSLEKRGYDLDRSDALTIMKLFAKYGLFEYLVDKKKSWCDNRTKEIMVVRSLSLYDLIQLRSEEATKLLTYTDYIEFARSKKLQQLPVEHRCKLNCVEHLCEKLSRRFFRDWALDCFMELTRFRFPILCCDLIIKQLSNQDLYRINLAAKRQHS